MKKVFAFLLAVMVNCILGATLATAAGLAPVLGAVALNAVGCVHMMPAGSLLSGVYTEIWTGEVVKKLRADEHGTWLEGIPDYSAYAENDVIHLVVAGADPDVLINNTTYPIDVQNITDTDKAISLDKFQTKATPVTDDELYAISYDKMASVKERHGDAITDKKIAKAIHAFAPASHTASTPVVETSGEVDNGRQRITRADIIKLKKYFDEMKAPKKDRRLVLCSDHVQDLLLLDQKFADQYYKYESGRITNMYGFDVYEDTDMPVYTTAGAKKSFGAAADTGEFQASVAFVVKRMWKASGSTNMYYSEARTDPQNQRNLVNFRHYFVALPKKNEAIGAIMSKAVVSQN